jgi:hypothetical protein
MQTKPKPVTNAAIRGQGETSQPVADCPPTKGNAKPDGGRKWSVTIPYVPPTVIEAADEADAWEKFKTKWGIVKSEHVPAITAVAG